MDVSTVPFYIHQQRVSTLYKLKMKLYPPGLYPPHTCISLEDCRSILRTTFVDAVENAISKHIELLYRISDIEFVPSKVDTSMEEGTDEEEDDDILGKSTNGEDGGANDEDEEEDANDDQGADAEKRKKQKCDEVEYEDEMEKQDALVADEFDGGTQSGFESEIDPVETDEFEVQRDGVPDTIDDNMDEDDHSRAGDEKTPGGQSLSAQKKFSKRKGKSKDKTTKITRRKKIKTLDFVEAKGLKFEAHFVLSNVQHILLAEIAQKTAKSIYIKESKNINLCTVVEPKLSTGHLALQISGVNFITFWDMQVVLDIDRVVTNDIHAILKAYGVEAARETIINEVKGVFGSYGISVNIRHLSLIADFMTTNGAYRPMNRLGMLDCNTSPFSKMTFETSARFIVDAAFHGERDALQSPSASVCLGQPVKYGTGCFDLLQNL